MSSYLIDTDWVIDYLKGKEETFDKLTSLVDDGLVRNIAFLASEFLPNRAVKRMREESL